MTTNLFSDIQQSFAALASGSMSVSAAQLAAGQVAHKCLLLLKAEQRKYQGSIGARMYDVFQHGTSVSRPVNTHLFISDPQRFLMQWDTATSINNLPAAGTFLSWDQVFYTASIAFACVFDLYQPTSRKTPGTFLEVIMTNLLRIVTGRQTGKYISLGKKGSFVTTDIVLLSPDNTRAHLVIPCKITTRERISQAFIHQRILDSAFPGRYRSLLLSMSEMQREGNTGVNEICVPTQIDIYNSYVAKLEGLYYLDLPTCYQALPNVHTGTLQTLLAHDLTHLL